MKLNAPDGSELCSAVYEQNQNKNLFLKPTFFTQFDLMIVEHTSDIRKLQYSL